LYSLQYTGPGFKPEVAGHMDEALEEYSRLTGTCLTQTRVLGLLEELLDDDAIVVGSSGSLPGDMQRLWRPRKPNTYHMEYGYSCMGYEITAALGVKLACPDKEVYSFVGDGSYMMLHSELVTSVQEGKKINVIVFDNNSFGCINNLQMGHGMGSYITEFRYRDSATGMLTGRLMPVDFAKNGESYGCKGYTVRNEEELRFAVEDAKKQTVSTVIDIKVLPKTMTDGYGSWWRVGSAEVAEKESALKATKKVKEEIKRARQY
ncbi:MAG TPA: thiamine pyrophosphate-dependent enzyme, partial [Candidatus Atribacteria bacterium]|nr:thiamine pyrophosphate-dependent enzyme [Candidatus Atribacteria bacterium]